MCGLDIDTATNVNRDPFDKVAGGPNRQGVFLIIWDNQEKNGHIEHINVTHLLATDTVQSDLLLFDTSIMTNMVVVDVASCNDIGCSVALNVSTTPPDPPETVVVQVAADDELLVTIEPPLNDGGASITHFNITRDIVGPVSFAHTSSVYVAEEEREETIRVAMPRSIKPIFHGSEEIT
jgi:hypothetical protein